MEKRYLSKEQQEQLNQNKWIIENGIFIKKKTEKTCLEALYLIEKNKDKLTDNLYAYITYLFINEFEQIEACGEKYYDDYQTFYSLYFNPNINKSQIIREYTEAVLELQNIGVNYKDVHSKNIIVDKENHIRLVDLDETCLAKSWDEGMDLKFIDLMITSILFFDVKDFVWNWLSPRLVLLELENKNLLTSSFLDVIKEKSDFDSFCSNVDQYLQELEDKEKSSILRKELKNKYPKWFIKNLS